MCDCIDFKIFRFLITVSQNQKKKEKICPEEGKDPRVVVSSEEGGEEGGLIVRMIGSVWTHRHVSFPSHSKKSQQCPITTTKVRRYPRSLERIHRSNTSMFTTKPQKKPAATHITFPTLYDRFSQR